MNPKSGSGIHSNASSSARLRAAPGGSSSGRLAVPGAGSGVNPRSGSGINNRVGSGLNPRTASGVGPGVGSGSGSGSGAVPGPDSTAARAALNTIIEAPALSGSRLPAGPGGSGGAGGPGSSGVRRHPMELPRQIDGHDIISLVGAGGMGSVFLAYEPLLDREVALKILSRSDNDQQRAADAARFLAEAALTGGLSHTGIIPIYRVGHDSSFGYYYTMRFVRGRTLQTVVERLALNDATYQEEFNLNRLLHIFLRICQAVGFAHQHHIVHRDIKPANLMVADFGETFVVDWGVAKKVKDSYVPDARLDAGGQAALDAARGRRVSATHPFLQLDRRTGNTGMLRMLQGARDPEIDRPKTSHALIVGTPGYLSPEQGEGKAGLTPASDVYSLGVTLYELLTLARPVEAQTAEAMIAKTVIGEIIPIRKRPAALQLPEAICDLVMKALATDPRERYADAKEMAEELNYYLEGRSPHRLMVTTTFGGALLPKNYEVLDGNVSVGDGGARLEQGARMRCRQAPPGDFRWECDVRVETIERRWVGNLGIAEVRPDKSVHPRYELRFGVDMRPFVELRRAGEPVQRRFDVRVFPDTQYHILVELEGGRLRCSFDGRLLIDYVDPFPQTGGALELFAEQGLLRVSTLKIQTRGAPLHLSFMVLPDRLYRVGRFAEARELYRQLASSHPDRAEGLVATYKAGLCSIELNEQQVAFAEFTRLEGTMIEYCCALGMAQVGLRDGNIDWAWEALKNAYQLNRGQQHVRSETWLSLLALIGRIDPAQTAERVRRLRELLTDLDPVPYEAAQLTFDLLQAVERDSGPAGVRAEAASLIERFDANAFVVSEAVLALGRAGIDEERMIVAAKAINRLLNDNDGAQDVPRLHMLRAELFLTGDRFDEAATSLRDAAVSAGWNHPDGLWARGWTAFVSYLRGKHAQVFIDLHDALSRTRGQHLPQVGYFHLIEGLTSLWRKQPDRAKSAFRKCCEFDSPWSRLIHQVLAGGRAADLLSACSDAPGALKAEVLYLAGEIYLATGDRMRAEDCYLSCLSGELSRALTMHLAEKRLSEIKA